MEVFGIWPHKWGAVTSRPPKGTSLRRNMSYDYRSLRSVHPFLHSSPFNQSPGILWLAMGWTLLEKYPFHLEHLHSHLIHGSLGPSDSAILNGISIGSDIFAQLMAQRPYTLQWATPFSKNCHFPWGSSGPPSNTWFLWTTRVHTQTASRSVNPFLQGSRLLQTDRPTDRPR